MAAIPVVGYRLGMVTDGSKRSIALRLQNGHQETIEPSSAGNFAALALILQESPVTFDPENNDLLTGWEQGD